MFRDRACFAHTPHWQIYHHCAGRKRAYLNWIRYRDWPRYIQVAASTHWKGNATSPRLLNTEISGHSKKPLWPKTRTGNHLAGAEPRATPGVRSGVRCMEGPGGRPPRASIASNGEGGQMPPSSRRRWGTRTRTWTNGARIRRAANYPIPHRSGPGGPLAPPQSSRTPTRQPTQTRSYERLDGRGHEQAPGGLQAPFIQLGQAVTG